MNEFSAFMYAHYNGIDDLGVCCMTRCVLDRFLLKSALLIEITIYGNKINEEKHPKEYNY